MTTIAYRDGVLAADTAETTGGTLVFGRTKVVRRDDGALIGASGLSGRCDAFRAWALAGANDDPPHMKDSIGIIVMPDGLIHVFNGEEEGEFELRPTYYAVGSGSDIALGAMFVGASAEDAVRAAICHDRNTGGEIVSVQAIPQAAMVQPRPKAVPAARLTDLEKMYEEADGPNRDSSHLPIAGGGYT